MVGLGLGPGPRSPATSTNARRGDRKNRWVCRWAHRWAPSRRRPRFLPFPKAHRPVVSRRDRN
ncbi:MAG TPA: hypothetical protein EYQ18_12055 [Candidatus Handelsmanbacteria bacterium]|nr:hypothetical protein [Candidatus Handelsmanbacteria bacterium]